MCVCVCVCVCHLNQTTKKLSYSCQIYFHIKLAMTAQDSRQSFAMTTPVSNLYN